MSAGRPTRQTGGSHGPDRIVRFLSALFAERRAGGGWVRVKDLADEARINKATAYRYLHCLEAHGFPIEYDQDNGNRGTACRGIRTQHYIARRPSPASEQGTSP